MDHGLCRFRKRVKPRPRRVVFVEDEDRDFSTLTFNSFGALSGYQPNDHYYRFLYATTATEHEFENCGNFDVSYMYAGPTQEEIFEEIVRECTELERHSVTVQRVPNTNLASETLALSSTPTLSTNSSTSDLEQLDYEDCYITVRNDKQKRERNRAAALRYRERKKKERETYSALAEELLLKNNGLKARVGDLEKELSVLRGLWNELKKVPH